MTHAHFLCERCAAQVPPVPNIMAAVGPDRVGVPVVALGAYDSPLGSAVRAVKYRSRVDLIAPLAVALGERAEATFGSLGGWVCMPVPAHPSRVKSRGYNQAGLLASAVSGPLGAKFDPDVLVRSRDTHPQPGLTARQRHTNVRGAFVRRRLHSAAVLLFDDVFSTGATAAACLEALDLSPGARAGIVVIARALS